MAYQKVINMLTVLTQHFCTYKKDHAHNTFVMCTVR